MHFPDAHLKGRGADSDVTAGMETGRVPLLTRSRALVGKALKKRWPPPLGGVRTQGRRREAGSPTTQSPDVWRTLALVVPGTCFPNFTYCTLGSCKVSPTSPPGSAGRPCGASLYTSSIEDARSIEDVLDAVCICPSPMPPPLGCGGSASFSPAPSLAQRCP